MKYFRLKPDYVLWKMSFANLMMYSMSLPESSIDPKDGKEKEVAGLEGLNALFGED